MDDRRRARRFAVLAVAALLGLGALAARVRAEETLLAFAAFVAFVGCGSRAVSLFHCDEILFERRKRRRPALKLLVIGTLAALLASHARAQQTIFNVPSADVLDPGKVYLETDELFRPTEPKFSSTTIRGVVGVFPHVEAGVNFGGFVSPGSILPTATVAVKAQPIHAGDFDVTIGGFGLFYLRGSQDGNPAGQGYGFATYRIPTLQTRISVGGWYSSAGYAKPNSTGGALATFEQPIPCVKGLTLAADWWSGENTIGYLSPGFYWSFGHWTAYAAYTIKNGDSKGDGGLIELGYAF
jgi:hypothetical protein